MLPVPHEPQHKYITLHIFCASLFHNQRIL
ncbi:hypothetical protein MTBUT4_440039 [Magnetospirillum sp. UT-4]|nr:hypothetical protein MTBUT4_440039 [Magnetospirillum sp. UT-4]